MRAFLHNHPQFYWKAACMSSFTTRTIACVHLLKLQQSISEPTRCAKQAQVVEDTNGFPDFRTLKLGHTRPPNHIHVAFLFVTITSHCTCPRSQDLCILHFYSPSLYYSHCHSVQTCSKHRLSAQSSLICCKYFSCPHRFIRPHSPLTTTYSPLHSIVVNWT